MGLSPSAQCPERAGISTKMRWGRVAGAAMATMLVACAFVALSGLDHDETVVQESGSAPDQDKMAADIWASLGGKHKKAPSLEGDGKGPLPPAPHLHHHAWRHHARHHHQDAEMMGMNKGKAAAKAAAKKGAKKEKAKKKAAAAKKKAKKAAKKAKKKAKKQAKKAKK